MPLEIILQDILKLLNWPFGWQACDRPLLLNLETKTYLM